MFLIETITGLQNKLKELNGNGTTGFVPTMGALHAGHISLVNQAVSENQIVVVSIFVNPTQFNDLSDFDRYPRTLETDLKLLEKTGCQIVFAPSVKEVYPETDTRKFDFGPLETVMEGKHRPGHQRCHNRRGRNKLRRGRIEQVESIKPGQHRRRRIRHNRGLPDTLQKRERGVTLPTRLGAGVLAPEQPAHTDDEFFRVERLDEVVVRSDQKACHPVHRLHAGARDEHYGQVRAEPIS